MKFKKYITELSMKKAEVDVDKVQKRYFSTIIRAKLPELEDRIFQEDLFFFEAQLEFDIEKVIAGLSFHMEDIAPMKKVMKMLDKEDPDWRSQTMGALKAVNFGFDPSFQDLEKEAVLEWRKLAIKKLINADIEGIWTISFTDESGDIAINPKEKGVALQVFAGVEESFKIFIKNYKPAMFMYDAVNTRELSRIKLYDKIASRIKKAGYIEIPKKILDLISEEYTKDWGFIDKKKYKIIKEVFML